MATVTASSLPERRREAQARRFTLARKIDYKRRMALKAVTLNEIERIFEVCHGCRMCFKYCDTFPNLFLLLDEKYDGDVTRITSSERRSVLDACFQCKLCDPHCPYTPPHRWEIDFPRLMLRAKAARVKERGMPLADRVVVGIEEVTERGIEQPVTRDVRRENKGLEEPRRMGAVPLRRTRVRHRSGRLILGAERRAQPLGLVAHRAVAGRESREGKGSGGGRGCHEVQPFRSRFILSPCPPPPNGGGSSPPVPLPLSGEGELVS